MNEYKNKTGNTLTAITLFTGFGGVDIALKNLGFNVVFGVEYDPKIAKVAIENLGDHIVVADINTYPTKNMPRNVFLLHGSPVCKSFSIAKANRKELALDIALAESTCHYIDHCNPTVFTLENVGGYRKSKSWQIIKEHLVKRNYVIQWEIINVADYGVPQNRKRMIVVAVKKGSNINFPLPYFEGMKTWKEHDEFRSLAEPNLPPKEPVKGWYQAVEDLIPTLEETTLAPWQKKRLPKEIKDKLFLQAGNVNSNGKIYNDVNEPARTVTGASGGVKLLIGGEGKAPQNPKSEEKPSPTVTASDYKRVDKILLIHTGNSNLRDSDAKEGRGVHDPDKPCNTVLANSERNSRIILMQTANTNMGNKDSAEGRGYIDDNKPSNTVLLQSRSAKIISTNPPKILRVSPRCLARWQTFPDWYKLPPVKKTACTGIGNAVPALFYEKLIRNLINNANT